MALVRWDQNREVDSLQSEVNRLFDTFFGGQPANKGFRRWVPAMDLVETDDHLVLKADLPGLDKDDVDIEVKDGVLTVSGERKTEDEERSRSGSMRSGSAPPLTRACSRFESRSLRTASPTGWRSAPRASTAERRRSSTSHEGSGPVITGPERCWRDRWRGTGCSLGVSGGPAHLHVFHRGKAQWPA
jgi:HSP20 family molecular chaperone IbpA